ncbi:MAG: cytochrome c nitrite reductase small subunit [Desulfobulbaceae bacterium]
MEKSKIMKYVSIGCVVAAVGMFAYVVKASNMVSYLSSDPKVCINCHTMNTQYATWQHSSHRERATCVQCHLPQQSLPGKLLAKSRDGFKHSLAMTLRSYGYNIRASADASERIQDNCIFCHREIVSQIMETSALYQNEGGGESGRRCWSCHRDVPHGTGRSLTATPDNIGVKEVNI